MIGVNPKCNQHAIQLGAVLIGEEDCPFCQLEENAETNKVFTIEPISSHPPGVDPMKVDSFNMGMSLGANVMVLHSTFPHEEMTWMVLVHIPTGRRIKIVFPEEGERMEELSMKDSLNALMDGVKDSLNALMDVGVESAIEEQQSNAETHPTFPGRYSKGGKE